MGQITEKVKEQHDRWNKCKSVDTELENNKKYQKDKVELKERSIQVATKLESSPVGQKVWWLWHRRRIFAITTSKPYMNKYDQAVVDVETVSPFKHKSTEDIAYLRGFWK